MLTTTQRTDFVNSITLEREIAALMEQHERTGDESLLEVAQAKKRKVSKLKRSLDF